MENIERRLLKDFSLEPKHPSPEAQQRWRSAVSLVRNRCRRFRHVPDLDKRSEAEKKKKNIQVLFPLYSLTHTNTLLSLYIYICVCVLFIWFSRIGFLLDLRYWQCFEILPKFLWFSSLFGCRENKSGILTFFFCQTYYHRRFFLITVYKTQSRVSNLTIWNCYLSYLAWFFFLLQWPSSVASLSHSFLFFSFS